MIEFKTARDVLLRNVNTRMEKHGEDDVPALDLALSLTGGNDLLGMLHPDLRAALFKSLSETEGELPLPVDDLPSVRFPLLQMPLKYDREWIGYTAKIAYGASGKADMVIGGVKVSKPQIAAVIEGGSVELRWNLSTTDVNEKVIGKLSLMQGHTISLTLTPPEAAPDEKKLTAADVFNPFPEVDAQGNPVKKATETDSTTPEQALLSTADAQE